MEGFSILCSMIFGVVSGWWGLFVRVFGFVYCNGGGCGLCI